MNNDLPFNVLLGKTFSRIKGLEAKSEQVDFITDEGKAYMMYHDQDCCEDVSIEDVCGNVDDLLGSPIIQADESTNHEDKALEDQDAFTWTFYRLATAKGSVQIRWYGESNGYYSESVQLDLLGQ